MVVLVVVVVVVVTDALLIVLHPSLMGSIKHEEEEDEEEEEGDPSWCLLSFSWLRGAVVVVSMKSSKRVNDLIDIGSINVVIDEEDDVDDVDRS